jgi:aminomethyltransferase
MDKVELTDKSNELTAIGVQGPRAPEILAKCGLEDPGLEAMQIADLKWKEVDVTLIRMGRNNLHSYEVWACPDTIPQLWNALTHAGAVPVGSDALEKFRIMMGLPKYGIDIRERDLPQETEQKHALNFTKGCYIGQEIVERIRSRGNVHRKFQGFVLEGDLPGQGTKLEADGKEIGEITSVSQLPGQNGERPVALGYIRREALERGAKITYPGGEARPVEVPISLAS